ncbi:MAG: DUF2147 domain-containing protein [Comamonadaceae bacterium]|nr:MAG: DUF2147 domain-containing protein [Comamonadaceae bacterium]
MKRILMTAVLSALSVVSLSAMAQSTPVGLWRTFDEKTSEPKSEVRITESGGVLSGKVEKRLLKNAVPDAVCTECSDDRKGQPLLGLEIIRGAKKTADANVWEGGKILDPENGKNYTLKMTPIEDGKKLEVRGSFGPFGRTQTWIRVPPA